MRFSQTPPKAKLLTSREVNEARRPLTCSRPCAFEEIPPRKTKKQKKNAPPKKHHEIHSSPATATTARRRATKHVPRISPYSPASINPGFVEIGLAQLSVKALVRWATGKRLTDRLPNLSLTSLSPPSEQRGLRFSYGAVRT